MNNANFITYLKSLNACSYAIEWSKDHGGDFSELWRDCHRGDWMLWLCGRVMDRYDRSLVLAKARAAKLVLHLMKDERSRKAVEVAEKYGLGRVGKEELDAAASDAASAASAAYPDYAAAYAAVYAAAYADAYAAAYADAAIISIYQQSSDIVRECVPFFEIIKEMKKS